MKHKVLLVLLLGIIISVSASAQKVTMNLKQVKLEKVFSAITQQTGLTVAYSRTIVNPDRIVTVEAKNQELSKVLNDLFLGTNVNYEIGKTKIYLKEKLRIPNNKPVMRTKEIYPAGWSMRKESLLLAPV